MHYTLFSFLLFRPFFFLFFLFGLVRRPTTLNSKMSHASAMTTSIQNPRLRLLNALRAGSKPIMTFLGLPSFRTAQIVAQTGVDVGIPRLGSILPC